MASPYWLTTPRLGLRRFTSEDLDWLRALYRKETVTRHLGGRRDHAQVEEMLRIRILDYYERHPGLGIWMTEERTSRTRLGFHLLNHIQGETLLQVGYVLDEAAWGRGFATEGARALLRYAFGELALPRLHAITTRDNHASQRVLYKVGLERHGERTFTHPQYAGAGPMAWFQRDRDDWQRWDAAGGR